MNARTGNSSRGRPLIILAAMLTLWAGMRFAFWPLETLRAMEDAIPGPVLAANEVQGSATDAGAIRVNGTSVASVAAPRSRRAESAWPSAVFRPGTSARPNGAWGEGASDDSPAAAMVLSSDLKRADFGYPTAQSASQNGAARSILPSQDLTFSSAVTQSDRWSFDSWLFLRAGPETGLAAAPRAYGASQAGMLLRYRFAPDSRLAPAAYARAAASPQGDLRAELAVGIALRPVASLPIEAQVELRLRERGGGIETRPAAMLVGGFDRSVAGFDARGYAQTGYIAGDDATAFADGKLTLEKAVRTRSGFRLAVGGGAWGGAQEGAARVDVGPSVSLTVSTGRFTARVEADYRIRVAGDSAPGPGPALTVSASF